MKNFKTLGLTLFSAAILLSYTMVVNAAETEAFYINARGAILTEEQYNRLSLVFNEETLNSMTSETLDMLKNETDLQTTETVKYIRTDQYFDRYGNLVDSYDTEVTESTALNYREELEIVPYAYQGTHTTSMKRLHMQVTGSHSVKSTTITNTWLSIPKVKSYDVIALRPVSGSLMLNSNSASLSGYQKYDGNYIYYDISGDNDKVVESGTPGVSFSMNIVDSTTTSLEMQMNLTVVSNYDPYNVYGAYQHATSDVSLNDSKNFNFSYYGLGNCLEFNNGIGSKYDGMQGLYLSYNLGEEYY